MEENLARLRQDVNALSLTVHRTRGDTETVLGQLERQNKDQAAEVQKQLAALQARTEALASDLTRLAARADELSQRLESLNRQGRAALPPALAQDSKGPVLTAESVLLLDPQGNVLFAKKPEEEHAPASLVKLMTLYLAYEDLEAGRASWDEPVTVSLRAARTPRHRMGLRAGEPVPLSVLLEGVAIASANDAATAVAEHLGGDEESFVARMNAKAQELGLTATRFANPHGLPDPNQRSTARDLAFLTGHLLHDYPVARTILGGKTFIYRGRVYSRRVPPFIESAGVQAFKTGFTHEAGYNLAVAAWLDGQRFLGVVLGAPSRSLSFLDAQRLLRYGLIQFGLEPPAEDGAPALPSGA